MTYALGVSVNRPFDPTLAEVREALAAQGFGVLTEIDLAATLMTKLGVVLAPQVVLGACNPPLAHRGLGVEASLGLLLPCNVVVRSLSADETRVEVLDPQTMVAVTGNPALADVAEDAGTRLRLVLAALDRPA